MDTVVTESIQVKKTKELKKLSVKKAYSITAYVNNPAIRFKEKLKAKKCELYWLITFFNKWKFRWKIKNYKDEIKK